MATLKEKKLVVSIKKIVRGAGYDFLLAYNDRHKDGSRRIKMMLNGYDYGKKNYARWDAKIQRAFVRCKIPVKSAGFELLERPGYGPYYAYIVRI